MNISDFFIIYLACGAPLGVYFFFQHRKKFVSTELWLKSFLTVFVWIPYAFLLLNDFATKRNRSKQFARETRLDAKISEIQKKLLQIQLKAGKKISAFEFREVLERYAGLTLACNQTNEETLVETEKELFRVSLRQNSQIAANCLHRRNRQRLEFHQKLSRTDFLQSIAEARVPGSESEKFISLAFEFVETLNDADARNSLAEIFNKNQQTESKISVKETEKEVWNPVELKPSPGNKTSAIHSTTPPLIMQTAAAAVTARMRQEKD